MAVSARAQWKGYLRFGEVTAPVALYTATSTSDRIAFHTVNRETGNRVRREFIDSVSGKPVEKEDQVKGYEIGDERYVVLEPEEVASAVPESDKTLRVRHSFPATTSKGLFRQALLSDTGQDGHGCLCLASGRHAQEEGRRNRPNGPLPAHAHRSASTA